MIKINEDTRKSYKEVYVIINNSTQEIKDKIPKRFMELLQNVISDRYEPNIDFSKSLLEQNLMPETITLLAIIYKNFLCDEDKKRELTEIEQKRLMQIELENRQKYSTDNLFKNNQSRQTQKHENTELLKVRKEKWYKRFVTKILNIFKINK